MQARHVLGCLLLLVEAACSSTREEAQSPSPTQVPVPSFAPTPGSFADDLAFLQSHTELVVLQDDAGQAQVAVAPEYQGRVMTSTAAGASGKSFGWIHRPVIARGKREPHMTVLGGEDRFWLGPEGGQFGLYFPKSAPFEFEHWQVPEPIDWGGFEVVSASAREVLFRSRMALENHLGTRFSLNVERRVRLLEPAELSQSLGSGPSSEVRAVGYESHNVITNVGPSAWTKETGLVSIWILGMFTPGQRTTVVIPVREGDPSVLGPTVKDDYFGTVPEHRLQRQSGHVFFRADGQERGKIGIPRARALPIAGSYDPDGRTLTLVEFQLPDTPRDYVDSRWGVQQAPYAGDVMNSYNDGPPSPGKPPLGPFYELESSSPVKPLAPGESLEHRHRTLHAEGEVAALDVIAKERLGGSLAAIEAALPVASTLPKRSVP
jgi:hypothetical protein